MKRLFNLVVWSFVFAASALAQATGPQIIASDLQSGPNSGGANNQGAVVTIYGFGFGATRGTSTVSIGGVSAGNYPQWSDTKISFQLGNAAVSGNIVVKVGGVASNSTSFTVRPGKIYFVSPTGADTNAGTFTAPWHGVVKAKNTAVAGDIIYLLNGVNETGLDSSSSNATLALAKSGTAALPIAIVAYPGATATIGSATGHSYGIRTTAAAGNWVLAGLTLRGAHSALAITNSSNWRVVGNDISCPNASGTGACVDFSNSKTVSLYRNRVHDVGSTTGTNLKLYQGVLFEEGSSTIDFGWNEIANVRSCRALQFSSDTTALFNITVRSNQIHDSRCDGINFANVNPSLGAVRAYNNVIYRAGTGPAPNGVESNYACINVGAGGTAAVQVLDNTLYDCGSRANGSSGALSASGAVTVINNIVYSLTGETYLAPNSLTTHFQGSNNLFYGAGASPAFSTASVHAGAKFVDPANANFQLQSISPAIDHGTNTGINRDIIQAPRPAGAAYDIGAYEYSASSTPPPPPPTPTPTPTPPPPTPTPTPTPPPTQGTLTVTPQSLAFGSVLLGSSAGKTVTLSNSSSAAVIVSKLAATGTGFSQSGPALPLTLSPGQTSTVTVTFAPQTAGSVTGALQITSNATNSSVTVSLTGTGSTVQHSATIAWDAATPAPSGYNVYRGTQSGGPYSKQNSAPLTVLTFTDNTVSSGTTYFYVVTSVAADGTESGFSTQVTAVVPNP